MKKKVLFLCAENSCHSQMAEGLLRQFQGDKYDVFSAGINPSAINKNAIDVMKEIGVDISSQTSKHLSELLNQNFDVIITINNDEENLYPNVFENAEIYNWRFFDPAEGLDAQKDLLPALRELRDQIEEKIYKYFSDEKK